LHSVQASVIFSLTPVFAMVFFFGSGATREVAAGGLEPPTRGL
jgi:hypothetical protein